MMRKMIELVVAFMAYAHVGMAMQDLGILEHCPVFTLICAVAVASVAARLVHGITRKVHWLR